MASNNNNQFNPTLSLGLESLSSQNTEVLAALLALQQQQQQQQQCISSFTSEENENNATAEKVSRVSYINIRSQTRLGS